MKHFEPRLTFDAQDYELVEVVNEFLAGGSQKRPDQLRRLFAPSLHPRGIKTLAASRQRRIAYAVIQLLDSLEEGNANERLVALRCLRDEVLYGGEGSMPRNTARVLIETMKQIVHEHGNYWQQVILAHDFFTAVSGRPAVIRKRLRHYHLLEMSEEWNQVTFDHHVHDANTKGRKAPTHLIMDAWIKGIRELTIVYYNFTTREAVAELLEAAKIMGVTVRVGVEVSARFRGKYVQFIWCPRGFEGTKDFLDFLDEPAVQKFFADGREVTDLRKIYVLTLLRWFNEKHLSRFNARYGIRLDPLDEDVFLNFVGVGQTSVIHLADFIHHLSLPLMRIRAREVGVALGSDTSTDSDLITQRDALNRLIPDVIFEDYLRPSCNPELPDPKIPTEGDDVPRLLRLSPVELLAELEALRFGCRITLNPSNLSHADVLELLYDANSAITHLEIFNLKDYRRKKTQYTESVAKVRRVLNSGNTIVAKQMVHEVISDLEQIGDPDHEDRIAKLHQILGDLPRLLSIYAQEPLKSRIGSDSVGRSRALFGMGLAVLSTLPAEARREQRKHPGTREVIPVRTEAQMHTVWVPRQSPVWIVARIQKALRSLPGLRQLAYDRRNSYVVQPNATNTAEKGNIVTLGGVEEAPNNNLSYSDEEFPGARPPSRFRWANINTSLKNVLKVAIGFVPAFLTFYLTKDWWLLAYFGAVIWFAITGFRNIIQSIVGGGGIFRSNLQNWKDLVSWGRVADSLLFTGFSVPLLDWLVKGVLLERGFGVTTTTSPLLLYSVMALANGIYLFSHNTFRGLPRAAAAGNFLRSVLSIPIAIALNALLLHLLVGAGIEVLAANLILQKWAAVIGKTASDIVAGFIEGAADRSTNMQTRYADYKSKLAALLEIHGKLEALFPKADVIEMLASPKEFIRAVEGEADKLKTRQIINALDLMYFWMYQPRARLAFRRQLASLTIDERQIILRTQFLLGRQRPVSRMFLDNLVGKNFSAALAFYLDKSPSYLAAMHRLEEQIAR